MNYHTSVYQTRPSLDNLLEKESSKAEPWKLKASDIKDVVTILVRLKNESDPAAFILSKFSNEKQSIIANYDNSKKQKVDIQSLLASELNKIIEDVNINLLAHIADDHVRSSVKLLSKTDPVGISLKRLRRLIIEDSFPGEFKQLPDDWALSRVWLGKENGILTVNQVRQIAPTVPAW